MNGYYQITAIDLYSRKRVLKLVNEHSSHETGKMLRTLEKGFGFKIKTVQTVQIDNGREFCNDREHKKTLFENILRQLCNIVKQIDTFLKYNFMKRQNYSCLSM